MSANSRALWAWLWVALCVAVILTFSGNAFSGAETGRFLRPLLEWLFPDITAREVFRIHYAIRKTAHLTEYAVLAMLSARAFRLSLDVPLLRVGGLTLLIVLSVAGLDELRQSTIATRTSSLGDVLIDLTGGALGVLVVIAIHRFFGVGAPAPKEGT